MCVLNVIVNLYGKDLLELYDISVKLSFQVRVSLSVTETCQNLTTECKVARQSCQGGWQAHPVAATV